MIVDITCFNCGHPWQTNTLTDPDPYLCHNCGLDNQTMKYEPEKLEAWKKSQMKEEKIPGGKAKGLTLQDLAKYHKLPLQSIKKKLDQGIKVEMEHTTDKSIAREIAMDHIYEDPNYYSKLKTIEKESVLEVGEANLKPYKWEEVDKEGYHIYLRFITDNETQYDVDLKTTTYTDNDSNDLRALEIEFGAKPKGAQGSSSKIVVNKGELYRVMSTLTDIIKKYIKKFKAQAVVYSPSKKSEEDFGAQRNQLYKVFISKAFPGVKFEQNGEIVAAILSNELEEGDKRGLDMYALELQKGLEEYITSSILNEKDPKTGTGKKPKGSGRRLYTDEDPSDTVSVKFKTKEDIVDTLNSASFKSKSHARQSQVINLIHQRVRAAYQNAKDPETKARLKRGLDYIETRKEASKEKTKRLQQMKEAEGSAVPYGSGYKKFIPELSQYMYENGMNIKPFPSVKFIEDDEVNAKDPLGMTAYYDPANTTIVLYTMGRHPKDILRSFAHEMVHHEQNLNGEVGTGKIKTTNTHEDDYLEQIERDAYEKGNIMLRKWTDSIKK